MGDNYIVRVRLGAIDSESVSDETSAAATAAIQATYPRAEVDHGGELIEVTVTAEFAGPVAAMGVLGLVVSAFGAAGLAVEFYGIDIARHLARVAGSLGRPGHSID
ncbi:hypothetical protein Cme02nite_38020 [Catellatospora methionotrophica]|uniref:Uncharacterized protein n=1 Tax=Catellatospora methionotrophica TaxID=121620 RepID=A0A8J3LB21_9ACTN|nr:hypothetical protein [Catellatospora methionotrophica]GIG15470.1 hypothetical protein Cme02nite_38020 [Catellatospora methionotrophica]